MFTGIIQAKGSIHEVHSSEKGAVLVINSNGLDLTDSNVGDSIAVNGVCLTATELKKNSFTADVSQETLSCTTFSELTKGQHVNLEKSLRLNQGIDGHLVSGHVDGIGEVDSVYTEGVSTRLKIKAMSGLMKYIAKKGSICINGVSLTVNSVVGNIFDVNIVPHTFSATTLGSLNEKSKVNLEIDIIARHVEQLINHQIDSGVDLLTPNKSKHL
ncbi:MAG: riboflavin synthase [Candidatus Thioglobus sp.]|jgi:riboflavin synthase|nr:riboflavin synthase [Candidatus Thioglobus sp.]|tara:strand:+ start:47 stop:688 length:642 start_codon:yes stop_codon:yes gene_type:complete